MLEGEKMDNKKVLIIDDEEHDRKAMVIVLEKAGYSEIACAETGQSGIEKARSVRPDIIVIDVVLPDMDGFDVCMQIKTSEEIKPKIIMITGHLDMVNAKKAVTSGADEIIEKEPSYGNICKTIDTLAKL